MSRKRQEGKINLSMTTAVVFIVGIAAGGWYYINQVIDDRWQDYELAATRYNSVMASAAQAYPAGNKAHDAASEFATCARNSKAISKLSIALAPPSNGAIKPEQAEQCQVLALDAVRREGRDVTAATRAIERIRRMTNTDAKPRSKD